MHALPLIDHPVRSTRRTNAGKGSKLRGDPVRRYVTSDGWFVLNLTEALAVRNEERGGTVYPLEPRDARFRDFGVNLRVFSPGEPNALYHAETGQEGFLVLAGECTLVVEEEERTLKQWDYFHCPSETRHVIVGGDAPCVVVMIGARPEDETLHYPVSAVAATYGASVANETYDPDEAYADWPGDYVPMRVPWPLRSEATR